MGRRAAERDGDWHPGMRRRRPRRGPRGARREHVWCVLEGTDFVLGVISGLILIIAGIAYLLGLIPGL